MRKQFVGIALAGAAGFVAAPMPALAQSQAITNSPVYVYAGPAPDYPVVSQLPANASVAVMGCVAGYTWCDVMVPGLRGWVYGGALYYPYQGMTVPAMNYGAVLGLPIIGFTLGAYWDSYYRDRPWYRDQGRWMHHAPPNAAPPPHFRPPPGHGLMPVVPHGRPGEAGGPRPGFGPGYGPGHGPGFDHAGGRPPGGPAVHAPGPAPGRPPGGGPGYVGGHPPGGGPAHAGGRPPGERPAGAAPGGRPPGGGGPGPSHGGGRPGGGGERPGGGGQHGGGERPGGGGGQHGGGDHRP
ncbi:MAG TPA: SH3 domain-containing protein [Paraburkholderia sp.]|jgi:uncharacterized protein YraI|nr:SH3 domain-containing protein [Paraburkholderia sp.]